MATELPRRRVDSSFNDRWTVLPLWICTAGSPKQQRALLEAKNTKLRKYLHTTGSSCLLDLSCCFPHVFIGKYCSDVTFKISHVLMANTWPRWLEENQLHLHGQINDDRWINIKSHTHTHKKQLKKSDIPKMHTDLSFLLARAPVCICHLMGFFFCPLSAWQYYHVVLIPRYICNIFWSFRMPSYVIY